ncbi:MAG TPA: histidine kinase [Kineosporiaceae bacterium]|nr:histidine kinase [Kineosporiaceae bacterium]
MRRHVADLPHGDVALALALLAVRLVTLISGIQPGSGSVSYLTAIGMTLPFAWRSRYPLAVAVAVSAANVVEVAVGYHDSVVALASWLIAAYSLGAHSTRVVRLVIGVLLTGLAGNWVALQQGPATFWNAVAVNGLLLASLLAGLWVRQLRLRAETVEQLAAQREREQDERARAAVAQERVRIARELHDEVAHAMSVIAVQADAAEGALARDPELAASPLVAIRDTARGALADMRRVVGALRSGPSPDLTPEPGIDGLGALLDQTRATGLTVDLTCEGTPRPLPPPVDVAAYRVVQEGLTNVLRHAAARRVDVVLRYDETDLDIRVSDDGDGGGPGDGSGYGIAGIRERVAVLGGQLSAGRCDDGFVLHVVLPFA